MIASLGMYLRPETQAATDRFWHLIRDNLRSEGIQAPDELARDAMFWDVWENPDLLFSQTCGRPYRLKLHDITTLVGTPDYGLADCEPGYYRSYFLVRSDDPRQSLADFRSAKFAYNEKLSQSGWSAPQCHAAEFGFQFEKLMLSGGHINSAQAVSDGRAEIAAVDAVSWLLMADYDDFAADLRVLTHTPPSPGLPYITGKNQDASRIAQSVGSAIDMLTPGDKQTLHLHGLVSIPEQAYLDVPNPV